MNTIPTIIETAIAQMAASLKLISNEASDIEKAYFATGANALIGALATDGTAATVSTKLTKGEVVNAISLCQQVKNFFGNSDVTQDDYLVTIQNLLNGTNAANSALSQDVESIGERLKQLGADLLIHFKTAKNILKMYSASELSAAVGAISNQTIVFGGSVTKSKLVSGITLVEQLKKMINNEAVTTGDYEATIVLWG